MQKEKTQKIKEERRQVYREIVDAFSVKYSWLGGQTAREMLMSAASWNIQKHSNPPFRYRTHVMLAWKRGYLKSTMMRVMAKILGDDLTSVMGKVTDAAMRGSVSGKQFQPPKPLRTPIVISTEFGQTNFDDELHNLFLNQLEEGVTNVSLNKIGVLSDNQRKNIENTFDERVKFKENNEYNLKSDFVFWGATYDPRQLEDDALRSRFNVVTPAKPLDHSITESVDSAPPVHSQLDTTTVKDVRSFLRSDREFPTSFQPTATLYREYNLNPRESRDIQSYMACRNWWGLEVNPEIMSDYIEFMQQSRRAFIQEPEERVFDLVFDNPMTYEEIEDRTGLTRREIYKIMQRIDAVRTNLKDETEWVVWSGAKKKEEEDEKEKEGSSFLSQYT